MGIVMARYGVSRKQEKRYSVFLFVQRCQPGYARAIKKPRCGAGREGKGTNVY